MSNRFLATLFLICFATTSAMAEMIAVPLKLDTATNKLSVTKKIPAVKKGDVIRLEISGVDANKKDKWHFNFVGGDSFSSEELTGGVAFEGTVPGKSGSIAIEMTDDDGVTALKDDILLKTNSGGGGGASTTVAEDAAESIVETSFRRTYDRRNDIINLYFNTSGLQVRGDIPRDVDDNDVIRIFLVGKRNDVENLDVEVEGTFSVADEFNSLGSGSLGDLTGLIPNLQAMGLGADDTAIYRLGTFGPYAPPSITIKISQKQEDGTKAILRQYPVRINKTYLASYRLLAGKSDIRFNKFEARTPAGQQNAVIENVSDEDGENRYFVTLVPYAWQFWNDSNWRGRDIAEPPSWPDRINPVIGVGLKDPGKEFVAGVSVEIARGLDVVWAWHRAEVDTLAGGYKAGDAFTGTSADIPKKKTTETSQIIGISLDLRVATQLLSSLFSN